MPLSDIERRQPNAMRIDVGVPAGGPQHRIGVNSRASGPGVRVVRRLDASTSDVFAAWLDSERAGTWLFATASRPVTEVSIDARVGGAFRFVERRDGAIDEHCGRYLEIIPTRRIVFALRTSLLAGVATRVCVEIASRGRGTALTLTHDDVPAGMRQRIRSRWSGILYGLAVVLDDTSE